MSSPTVPLLGSNLRSWISSKGIWLVALAALFPLVITGAWVGAHRADVTAESITVPEGMRDGEAATLTALVRNNGPTRVDSVNATLEVGTVGFDGSVIPVATRTVTLEDLNPGDEREVTLDWNATGGVRVAALWIDPTDAVPEVDEHDNLAAKAFAVPYRAGGSAESPTAPASVRGNETANATADFAIASLKRGDLTPGQPASLEAVVENRGTEAADVIVNVRALQVFQGGTFPTSTTQKNVTLEPGASTTVALEWVAGEGAWWHEAWVEPPEGTREATPEDNHKAEPFAADVALGNDTELPRAPERQTIEDFYGDVLEILHLQILIPFIALFYAGGVIADERDRGALPYVLTRPVPRWLIPLTKFVASFAVAALAIVAGIALTFLLLFRTTPEGSDAGFLVTPLLLSLLTLLAYGALFTLIGVWSPRPYLVGIAWVLGWEIVAYNFVPFVQNLTLQSHVRNALHEWPLDGGVQWLPPTEGGMRAILVLVAATVGMLVAASVMMKNREFEV